MISPKTVAVSSKSILLLSLPLSPSLRLSVSQFPCLSRFPLPFARSLVTLACGLLPIDCSLMPLHHRSRVSRSPLARSLMRSIVSIDMVAFARGFVSRTQRMPFGQNKSGLMVEAFPAATRRVLPSSPNPELSILSSDANPCDCNQVRRCVAGCYRLTLKHAELTLPNLT